MNFNLGNAMKYIWRSSLKHSEFEDLEKAKWYIDDEIKRLGKIFGDDFKKANPQIFNPKNS